MVGLGNSIRADDGVGIHVARSLRARGVPPNVTVVEASVSGLDILDLLCNYDRAIIIDAIQTGVGPVGKIRRLDSSALYTTRHSVNPHSTDFAAAIELGKELRLPLPQETTVFAVEIADATSFGEECTADVAKAIPDCVDRVLDELRGKIPIRGEH